MRSLLVIFAIYIAVIALFVLPALLLNGCAGQGLQERWEECAEMRHTGCWQLDVEDPMTCEYEYYERCIGG